MAKEKLKVVGSKLKMAVATATAVVAMSATVFAGTRTVNVNESFTIPAGATAWDSENFSFSKDSAHTIKANFRKTYTSGKAHIGIYKNIAAWGVKVKAVDTPITTATTGVQKSVTLYDVSKGTRHYVFGSDGSCSYSISSFSDTWNN